MQPAHGLLEEQGPWGPYDYFFCMGRRNKASRCSRSYVSVERVEEGIEAFYRSLQLSEARAALIRATIVRELSGQTEQTARDVAEARRQYARLETERQKLPEAHYAGAIPLDMLKREMERLTRQLREADTRANTVARDQEDLTRLLDAALMLATHCYDLYQRATHRERRLFNQGFFTRLYIDAEGGVDHAELQETFIQLVARDEGGTITRTKPERDTTGDAKPSLPDPPAISTMPSTSLSRGQKPPYTGSGRPVRPSFSVLLKINEPNFRWVRTTFGGGGGI